MHQYYAISKETEKLSFISGSLLLLKDAIKGIGKSEEDFIITEDIDMRYISRIVYVDGECIYNKKDFWLNNAAEIVSSYSDHEVLDVLGDPVDIDRFKTEMNSNQSRLSSIEGTAGEVEYNMIVGSEIISLLREECISKGHGNVTPESMFLKMFQVILALQIGCFREVIPMLDEVERDEFFTDDRIAKYQAMIASADVITYDQVTDEPDPAAEEPTTATEE